MPSGSPAANSGPVNPGVPGSIDLLATCTFGLEAVVVRELEQMGYAAKGVGTGRVHFSGDLPAIAEANIRLRAADRVLVRIGEFPVGGGDAGFDQLFEGVKRLPWEGWVAPGSAFPVSGRCVRSAITSEPAVQRATKRAMVERLRIAYRRGGDAALPENGPKVQVEVALVNNVATFTIDTSGPGLHKRGYREGTPGEAALKETLAAGLVLLSVWRPGRVLVDPFCGSGTIAIEAALLARRIAPGLRRSFEAEQWLGESGRPLIGAAVWSAARERARAEILPGPIDPPFFASDISEEAVRTTRINAERAGVAGDLRVERRAFEEFASPLEYGCIVTNPPYGVRLGGEDEVERLYASMPGVFRQLPTWSFHVFTGRLDMERLVGRPATRRRKMYNSKIECCYFSFLGPRPVRG